MYFRKEQKTGEEQNASFLLLDGLFQSFIPELQGIVARNHVTHKLAIVCYITLVSAAYPAQP